MKNYIEVLKKYADFNGRASRKEYWMFVLFYAIFAIVASVLDTQISGQALTGPNISASHGVIKTIYSLGTLLPSLAVSVRRLHDIGKSGWWMLLPAVWVLFLFFGVFFSAIFFIVIPIGYLVILSFHLQESDAGENAYGPNPNDTAAVTQ